MVAIRVSATVTADGQLIVELPQGIPPGQVEIVIQTAETVAAVTNPNRDAARSKLAAAGQLSTAYSQYDQTERPTDEQVRAAGKLPAGARGSEALIAEDRDAR